MHSNVTDAAIIAEKMRNGSILSVIFDFDGTLYSSNAGIEAQLKPAMVKTAALALSIPAEEARLTLLKYRTQYKSSVLGLQNHHGIDPFTFYNDVYDSLNLEKMSPYPGLAEAITTLGSRATIYLLTNSNRSFTQRALKILDIKPTSFAEIITVEDNGYIRKPNKEVYERLFIDRISTPPEKSLFFDDIPSSLEVVHGFGSYTALVGNGLRAHPRFVDLHTEREYDKKPGFVDFSTHNISDLLQAINAF